MALAFTFDERPISASARSYDVDGRLRVQLTPVSKATVSEYLGSEIPGAEALGLDPQATYAMLRPAAELRKAASSMNGVPLLREHQPMDATSFDPSLVIGACLDDAKFEAPYLRCSIIVWDGAAIKNIEDGSQRQLSAGYAYRAAMQSGVFETEPYDGKMLDIRFNHLTLVAVGRDGPSVQVADRLPVWLVGERRRYAAA